MKLPSILTSLAISAVSFLFLSAITVSQADPLKVGFVYVGPICDHGWS